MIVRGQLEKYRELAENTQFVSRLGEFTPPEFIELLDYIAELEARLAVSESHKAESVPEFGSDEWFDGIEPIPF